MESVQSAIVCLANGVNRARAVKSDSRERERSSLWSRSPGSSGSSGNLCPQPARRADAISFVRKQRECEKAECRAAEQVPRFPGADRRRRQRRLCRAQESAASSYRAHASPPPPPPPRPSLIPRRRHYHYRRRDVRALITSSELVGINWSHQLTRALSGRSSCRYAPATGVSDGEGRERSAAIERTALLPPPISRRLRKSEDTSLQG